VALELNDMLADDSIDAVVNLTPHTRTRASVALCLEAASRCSARSRWARTSTRVAHWKRSARDDGLCASVVHRTRSSARSASGAVARSTAADR
jgi:hypothetical protein